MDQVATEQDGPLLPFDNHDQDSEQTLQSMSSHERYETTTGLPTSVSLAQPSSKPAAESALSLQPLSIPKLKNGQRPERVSRKEHNHEQRREQRRQRKMNMRRRRVMLEAERVQDCEPTMPIPQNQLPEFEFLEIIENRDTPLDFAGFGSLTLSEKEPSAITPTTRMGETSSILAGSTTPGQFETVSPVEDRAESTVPLADILDNMGALATEAPQQQQPEYSAEIFRPNGTIASPFRYSEPPPPPAPIPENISTRRLTMRELQTLPSILQDRYRLESICVRPNCPIRGWHNEGIYLHEGMSVVFLSPP